MDEKKHAFTPGPWKWDEPDNWFGMSARICNEKCEPIAQVPISGWPKRVGRANAALLAAAPALLAACELHEAWVTYRTKETITEKDEEEFRKRWEVPENVRAVEWVNQTRRAAIRLATGAQP